MNGKQVNDEVIRELHMIVGEHRMLMGEENLNSYAFDASFGYFVPEAVVQPTSTDEVARIVRLANRFLIPITPRGQSTSLSGGPLPVQGGIVIDMSRMKDKLIIDEEDLVAIVSPGVITADIHRAAEVKGLMYPPDPSSSHVSTIGGNLAENSGGPRGLKYGVTKDYVIGLEVVTPMGEIVRTGGRTIKNVTGYDLTKLLVGSEGTLGIITEAILRLIPVPPAKKTLLACFDQLEDSGRAISATLASGIVPAKIEMMDRYCMEAVEKYESSQLPTEAEAMLLFELDGHPAAIADEIHKVQSICKEHRASIIRTADNEAEEEQLWRARKLVSPAIARIKPTKIAEDICVPKSKIAEAFKRIQQIRERYGLQLVVFGHAGDGNLHPNIVCDQRDKEEMRRVELAVEELFKMAIEFGGTLSGEHGIGTMKAPFMEMELGEHSLRWMEQIKRALDPNGIMNPGKIFPKPGQRLVLSDE